MSHIGRHFAGLLCAFAVTIAVPDSAIADPTTPPSNPSDSDIADADGQVTAQLGQVGTLINQIAVADQRIQQLDDDVATKREAVNKALVDLQAARGAVDDANQRVDSTRRGMTDAAADIARAQRGFDDYAAQMYTSGGSLSTFAAVTGTTTPEETLDRGELVDLVGKSHEKALDGLARARIERANRNSAARAAQIAAASAAADAQRKKAAAEQSAVAARSAADQQVAQKAAIERRRTDAQNQLDAARAHVTGLQGQRAAFIAWDTRRKAEEAVRTALIKAAQQAAMTAIQRVAENAAARDRAADLANGRPPHTMFDDGGEPGRRSATRPTGPRPTGSAAIETVVDRAMSQLGVIYAWGGGDENGPTLGIRDGGVADRHGDYHKVGFDCSGLMVYAFAGVGISLPHYSGYQYNEGTRVGLAQRKRGDMLFWGRGGRQHVALYLGDNQMIEAPESGEVVRIVPVRMAGIQQYVVRMIG